MQRELDRCVDLARALCLRRGESLKVYHQDLGGPRDDDLLGRHPFAFAVRALPDLVAAQHLLLAVAAQALVDIPRSRRRDLHADAVERLVCRRRPLAGRAPQSTRMLPRKQ